MPSVKLQPSLGETPHSTASLSTTAQRSSQSLTSPTCFPSGMAHCSMRTRGNSARPSSASPSAISSSSYEFNQTSSGQSRWHQGETSSKVNGMGPRGVESRIMLLGSSSSAETTAPSAESRHGGVVPSISTTLSGPESEPSHHDPGNLHRMERRVCRCRTYGLVPMSSLSFSPPLLTGLVDTMRSMAETPTGPSGIFSSCSSTQVKASLSCGEA